MNSYIFFIIKKSTILDKQKFSNVKVNFSC